MAAGTLQQTPSGRYIPPSPDLPGGLPLSDAWAVLSPFMDSPALRLGRRTSALNLTVDLMIEMQHDELIALLKGYQAALLVNADYEIRCSNPQKQAFFEAMYRAVHRPLMLACSPALFFGFQAMIKIFDFGLPSTDSDTPLWDGTAEPLILTGVKQIHPANALPHWSDAGDFGGIKVKGLREPIPPLYSLWLTIGKHLVFGDYFGWGRARTAYLPWWKKQFTDDQETLFIQRGVDPVPVVGHPEGSTKEGKLYSEIAAEVGEAARAGSTITVPTTVYNIRGGEGYDAQLGNIRRWTIDYLINTANIAPFLDILSRVDRQIAMAMLIPPQAVLESKSLGLGGPNTAEILGTVAEDMLMQDAAEIDRHLNEYVFPFVSNANWGPDNAPVTKTTTGLSGKSKAGLQAIWDKLIDAKAADTSIIDFGRITEQLDIPMLSEDEAKAAAAALAAQQAAAQAAQQGQQQGSGQPQQGQQGNQAQQGAPGSQGGTQQGSGAGIQQALQFADVGGNPYHDDKGRFTAHSGAGAAGSPPDPYKAKFGAETGNYRQMNDTGPMELFGNKYYSDWADGLSSDERSAIEGYTNTSFTQINEHLRGQRHDDLSPALTADIGHLDSAIGKATVPYNVVAHRGFAPPEGLQKGGTFQDNAYVSTSLHQGVANDRRVSQGTTAALARIKVRQGQKGAYVHKLLDAKEEYELLLPRGSRFSVDDISEGEYNGRPVTYYDLTLQD